ncbi:MAG TPA: hypothetical protein VMF03_08445 [Steroidobacteraceae bacterium]|nr:hypothetical protein [Steroidobacteraceae bacterium]
MMPGNEAPEDRPYPSGALSVLSLVAGVVAMCAFTWIAGHWSGLLFTQPVNEPPGWHGFLAMNLCLCAGAIWGLLSLKPLKAAVNVLSMLLVIMGLFGFALALGLLKVQRTFPWPWPWQVECMVAVNLALGAAAILGLLGLKPWKTWQRQDEPLSPRTRRSVNLLWLATAIVAASALALVVDGARSAGPRVDSFGDWINSPISRGLACFVIAGWLLGMAINKWWWYFSADEHERRSDDFGNLLAWAVFLIVTPAWWVAARAGLVPRPDAMLLWLVTSVIAALGWFWRRNA